MRLRRIIERGLLWTRMAVGAGFLVAAWVGSDGLAVGAGEIVGWGYDIHGQSSPPSGTDFIAIAAGQYHSLGLQMDGSIVGWGEDFYGQSSPPAGTDFVAVSGGGWHSLGLKSDGSIVGWGRDDYGQASPPAGTDFVAIASGWSHSLGLKSDGSIAGWGYDSSGQASPPVGTDFIAIAAGYNHGLALRSDGSLVGWGQDSFGQASPPAGTDFVAIAAGMYHSLGLKNDESIVAWGRDNYGQASPPAGTDFVAIAAGYYHGLGLKGDGRIVAWGRDDYAQVTDTPAGSNFVAIEGGGGHSMALSVPPVPQLVNYQGRLNDSSGDPLAGVAVDLTFRLYDDAFAGNLLLTDHQTGVQVTEGIFDVLMGSGTLTPGTESTLGTLFQNHRGVWVSTEVESDGEMTPRQLIVSVGYATRAGSAADLTQVVPRSTAPASPAKGDVYMDDTTNKLMVYDGTTWQACW